MATIQSNIEVIARGTLEQLWNQRSLGFIDENYAKDYVEHDMLLGDLDVAGVKASINSYFTAFPDVQLNCLDCIVAGEKAILRWKGTGTNRGAFAGNPPTGRRGSTEGVSILRFEKGKVKEGWNVWNVLGLMQQLGVAQPLGAAAQAPAMAASPEARH